MKNSVTFREKIGYGFGDMASSMFWKIFGMYLLFFYTKVFGITPAAAGTMFLVTRIWDSLNDPIMGLLADRTRSRWGRYRPYLLWGAFPFAAVGVLTFWTPDFGMTGKLAWAYITYTAMMMVYTMVNVPYASLLGVMTPDTKIRNTFSSYRMFFAYVGSLVTFMLLQPLVDFFAGRLGGGDTDRLSGSVAGSDVAISGMPEAWTCAVAVIGAICALLFWLCFRWTRERIRVDDAQLAEGSVGRDLKSLARNTPWWILLVAGVAVLLFNSIRDGVAIFYFTDYVRSALPAAGSVGQHGRSGTGRAVGGAHRQERSICRGNGCGSGTKPLLLPAGAFRTGMAVCLAGARQRCGGRRAAFVVEHVCRYR